MTMFQRAMLDYLNGRAVHLLGAWVWPIDVRQSPRYAEALYHVVFG